MHLGGVAYCHGVELVYCVLYSVLSFRAFPLAYGWVVICNKLIPVVFSSNFS